MHFGRSLAFLSLVAAPYTLFPCSSVLDRVLLDSVNAMFLELTINVPRAALVLLAFEEDSD